MMRILVADVVAAAAAVSGLRRSDLTGDDRHAVVTRVRLTAMAVAVRITGKSLPQVGAGFGGRDHSTVSHAVRVTAERVAADAGVATLVQEIERQAGVVACARLARWQAVAGQIKSGATA